MKTCIIEESINSSAPKHCLPARERKRKKNLRIVNKAFDNHRRDKRQRFFQDNNNVEFAE